MNVETKIKLDRFKPRSYQYPICEALEQKGYKKLLCILPRRAGKDIVAWNLMIRAAIRKVGVYMYCLPTFRQAKLVIWDSITNDGRRFLDFIPKELIESTNSQEMKIKLINGSIIQLIGSDTYDTSLVGTNPRMVVMSEFALADSRALAYVRPILNANGGTMMILSCVNPETLVITQDGLTRIKDVSSVIDTYTPYNKPIRGLGGFHRATDFYYGGIQPTLKITLAAGYHLECTSIHPVWNGREWIQAQHLNVGDLLPIQYGQDVWGAGLDLSSFSYQGRLSALDALPDTSSIDFFYLLGLMHADGNYDGNKMCITKKKDPEIVEFLRSYGFRTRPDGIHHEFSSRALCKLLDHVGFKHGALNKEFPASLLRCTKDQMRAFMQGVFDGDGTSNSHPSKKGRLKLSSACKKFLEDVQIVLLNFGIVSSIYREEKKPTIKVKVNTVLYNLEIQGYFAHLFYEEIGFRLMRKQQNKKHIPESIKKESGNIYPIDREKLFDYSLDSKQITNPNRITRRVIRELNDKNPHAYLQHLLDEKFFYSSIKHIEQSSSPVYDFVIPETNSFFSNGFISHNTPRGRNHLWELYNIAKESPDWFCYKLTLEDTQHIPWEEVQREIASGEISEDLVAQEYLTSFDLGVEGAYYTKYIDRLRLNNQIGIVEWEPAFPVSTVWDLGVSDMTVIIFFQVIGQTIRIIDYYENHDYGLDHYVKIVQQKPYVYKTHLAPHDIEVREWAAGAITRREKARQLGINFTVVPNLPLEDGIEAVRSIMSKMWIDEKRCSNLIKAIESYRREYDHKRKVYRDNPLHDWSSHAADCLRYLCIGLPKTRDGSTPEDLDKRYRQAMYGDKANMPSFFRDDLPGY